MSTGVPFEPMNVEALQALATRLDGPALSARWLAYWPNAQLPIVVVSLYRTEREARTGFEYDVSIARSLASPRCSYEVMRVGRLVLRLEADSWNQSANQWLERVRAVFSDADAVERVA